MPEPIDALVERVFLEALEQVPEARPAYVDRVLEGASTARDRVLELLRDLARADRAGFLARAAAPAPGTATRASLLRELGPPHAGPSDPLDPGSFIGAYRLLGVIGEGGMGVVHLAEIPSRPGQRFAIKVMRAGGDPSRLATWLERERRALASLDHPSIPPLLDSGRIDGAEGRGWPFIVTPFLDGLPITACAERERLSMRDRLTLIETVCRAVHHAHERGVVHRDLKPSNILVVRGDDGWRPCVIDFGVSVGTELDESGPRATSPQTSPPTSPGPGRAGTKAAVPPFDPRAPRPGPERLTEEGDVVGTPEYMSPEQARGEETDRRTDVFALGMVLRELLDIPDVGDVGHRPSSDSASVPASVPASASGDLFEPRLLMETSRVAAMALAEDPGRRYATAEALADDLRSVRDGTAPLLARRCASARAELGAERGAGPGAPGAGPSPEPDDRVSDSSAVARLRRARLVAERERDEAQHQASLAALAAAESAWRDGSLAEARRRLAHTPAQYRGFEWRHLAARLVDESVLVLRGHEDWVVGVAISPCGRMIASCSRDRTVRIWDAERGAPRHVLEGHDDLVHAVAFLPERCAHTDHPDLASASWDGTVRLWSARLGTAQGVLRGPRDWLASLAVADAGRSLLCGGGAGRIRCWSSLDDWSTSDVRFDIDAHRGVIYGVACSPDGTRFATASADGSIGLWNLADGTPLGTLRGHGDWVRCVCFRDDRTLISGGADGTIRIWNLATRRGRAVRGTDTERVYGVALDRSGTHLVAAHGDASVGRWERRRRNSSRFAPLPRLRGHEERVFAVAVRPGTGAPETDESWRIASASEDGTLRLWPWRQGEKACRAAQIGRDPILAVTAPGDGGLVLAGRGDRAVDLWGATSEDEATPAWRPTSSRRQAGRLMLVDLMDGRAVATILRRDARVVAIAPHPRDEVIAVAFEDGVVVLLDSRRSPPTVTGRMLETAPGSTRRGHVGGVRSIAWHPTAPILASAGTDRTVRLWNLVDGALLQTWRGHLDRVNAVRFSSDGAMLASASNDRTIRLWPIASASMSGSGSESEHDSDALVIHGHREWVMSLAFSPDGAIIASGSADRTVRLWSARSGAPQAICHGHSTWVVDVDFSPDGLRLVSASWDRSLRLWETSTGEATLVLRGHADRVNSARFSADGSAIVSCDWSGSVRRWSTEGWRSVAGNYPR